MATEPRELTLGETRVRWGFNPSDNALVRVIKRQTAELIDFCEDLKALDPRLAALAQTAYEEACLWAVKAATTMQPHLGGAEKEEQLT